MVISIRDNDYRKRYIDCFQVYKDRWSFKF